MHLIKQILTNSYTYKKNQKLVPKGVMVHSTAANNPYIKRYVQPDDTGLLGINSNNNDWNKADLKKSVHAFIGKLKDGSIATCQTLPFTMRAMHCGGNANGTHISFEICEDDLTNPTYFKQIYKEAVEFTAYLCKEFNLDPTKDGVVICHQEGNWRGVASAHEDVLHWFPKFGKTMNMFRRDVKAEMEANDMTKEETIEIVQNALDNRMPVYKTIDDVPEWYRPAVQEQMDKGFIKGDDKGDINVSLDLCRMLTILDRAGVV